MQSCRGTACLHLLFGAVPALISGTISVVTQYNRL